MLARQFAWIDAKTGKFHRSKKPIETPEQMQAAVKYHWRDACYQSVYEFTNWKDGRPVKESAIVDRIYFDFDDADNPQNAIDDAAKIACDYTTQWFSGKRGIGMLLHFKPVDIHPSMKADVLKRTCNAMIEHFDLQTADHAVIGDLNRVHRIMNTRHQDTGLYAIPIAPIELRHFSIDKIREMAKNRRDMVRDTKPSMLHTDYMQAVERTIIDGRMMELLKNRLLSPRFYEDHHMVRPEEKELIIETLERLEAELSRIKKEKYVDLRREILGSTAEETWLIHAARQFKATGRAANGSRTSEHKARVHLAKLANECGWTFGEICDIYTGADDYDPAITERMVKSCLHK